MTSAANNNSRNAAGFPPGYRASGVLLHVTSLPSPYGIGDLGPSAVRWIEMLHEAGQRWWQALPLGPTGYGNSPYQPLSSFAGNELLISPDWLIEDGMVRKDDCVTSVSSDAAIDYETVIPFKRRLVETAWNNFNAARCPELAAAFDKFCGEQAHWLDDYALFRALKVRYIDAPWQQWPVDLRRRAPAAIATVQRELAVQMQVHRFAQFLLFRQGARLRQHARANGVQLIGDAPFYVSLDSSDVWGNPELFLLDEQFRPRFVAGVPPDYFSPSGQLWGNPVYNWEALRRTGYRWCIDRFRAILSHVDLIRLDHFRGFAAAWHVPADATSAQSGHWAPGPGADFFNAVKKGLGETPFLAEDLGLITPDVSALLDQFKLPGTRVLQFAFDGHSDNPHLPDNVTPNTVIYTGTHDNPPSRAWYQELPGDDRANLWRYHSLPSGDEHDVAWSLIRLAWSSAAALAIAPLQDLFNLGPEARMNFPGRADGNWRWRCSEELLHGLPLHRLFCLTQLSGRHEAPPPLAERGKCVTAS